MAFFTRDERNKFHCGCVRGIALQMKNITKHREFAIAFLSVIMTLGKGSWVATFSIDHKSRRAHEGAWLATTHLFGKFSQKSDTVEPEKTDSPTRGQPLYKGH